MRIALAIVVGVIIGTFATIIFACMALESKLDREEEQREHDRMHMRR